MSEGYSSTAGSIRQASLNAQQWASYIRNQQKQRASFNSAATSMQQSAATEGYQSNTPSYQTGMSGEQAQTALNEYGERIASGLSYYDIDTQLKSLYNIAKTNGISVPVPAEYGKSVKDSAVAQGILDRYISKINIASIQQSTKTALLDLQSQARSVGLNIHGISDSVIEDLRTEAAATELINSYSAEINNKLLSTSVTSALNSIAAQASSAGVYSTTPVVSGNLTTEAAQKIVDDYAARVNQLILEKNVSDQLSSIKSQAASLGVTVATPSISGVTSSNAQALLDNYVSKVNAALAAKVVTTATYTIYDELGRSYGVSKAQYDQLKAWQAKNSANNTYNVIPEEVANGGTSWWINSAGFYEWTPTTASDKAHLAEINSQRAQSGLAPWKTLQTSAAETSSYKAWEEESAHQDQRTTGTSKRLTIISPTVKTDSKIESSGTKNIGESSVRLFNSTLTASELKTLNQEYKVELSTGKGAVGTASVFHNDNYDLTVKAEKAAAVAELKALQAARAAYTEVITVGGKVVNAIQKVGAESVGEGNVTIYTQNSSGKITSRSGTSEEYSQALASAKKVASIVITGDMTAADRKTIEEARTYYNARAVTSVDFSAKDVKQVVSIEKTGSKYLKELEKTKQQAASSNPVVSAIGKANLAVDSVVHPNKATLAGSILSFVESASYGELKYLSSIFDVAEKVGLGQQLSEKEYLTLQKATGLGSSKTYSDLTNKISSSLDRTVISVETENDIVKSLDNLNDMLKNAVFENKISKTAYTGVNSLLGSYAQPLQAPFQVVSKSVANVTDIVPETVVSLNAAPKFVGSALKELETLAKNPSYAAPSVAFAVGSMIAATNKGLVEDPAKTIAEFAVQDAEIKAGLKSLEAIAKVSGKASGIIDTSMKVVPYSDDIIPLKTKGDILKTLLTEERVSGARATGNGKLGEGVKIAIPSSSGEVKLVNGEWVPIASKRSTFMTLSSGKTSTVGEYFLKKDSKFKLSQRITKIEGVQTAKLPSTFIAKVEKSIKENNNFIEHYNTWEEIAQKQANRTGEPVAIPAPKAASGYAQQENEVVLIFPEDVGRFVAKNKGEIAKKYGPSTPAYKYASKKISGFTSNGNVIVKVSFGTMKKPANTLKSIAENLAYYSKKAVDKHGVYSKNDQLAALSAAISRDEQLYGNALTFKNTFEYGQHGLEHASNVEKNLIAINSENDLGVKLSYLQDLARYHDITKIGSHDLAFGGEHAISGARAIRSGKLPGLVGKDAAYLEKLATDIELHTGIKPLKSSVITSKLKVSSLKHPLKTLKSTTGEIAAGVKTSVLSKPSVEAKMLANADRLDLTRFGVVVDESKLFSLKGDSNLLKLNSVFEAQQRAVMNSRFIVDETAGVSLGKRMTKDFSLSKEDTSGLKKLESISKEESLEKYSQYAEESKLNNYYIPKTKYNSKYASSAENTYVRQLKGDYNITPKKTKYAYKAQTKNNYNYKSNAGYRNYSSSAEYKKGSYRNYSGDYSVSAGNYSYPVIKSNYVNKSASYPKTPVSGNYTGKYAKSTPKKGNYVPLPGDIISVYPGTPTPDRKILSLPVKKVQAAFLKQETAEKTKQLRDLVKLSRRIQNVLGGLDSILG